MTKADGKQIFLSYARADADRVSAVAAVFQSQMWSVWLDRDDIDIGVRYEAETAAAIEGAGCVVVFWSAESVQSMWVHSEADSARVADKLVPVRLNTCKVPMPFDRYQTADLTTWDGRSRDHPELKKLLRSIAKRLPPQPAPVEAERSIAQWMAPPGGAGSASDDLPASDFDRLYVVSDLNLGGPPDLQFMNQGARLARFIDHLIHEAPDRRLGLVVNGNLVDVAGASFDGMVAVNDAVRVLEGTWNDPSFAPVWNRLSAFVCTPNRHLIRVLGNSEVELALPAPAAAVTARLTDGDAGARGRFTLVGRSATFSCRVGHARVLCKHGHDVDPWNSVDYGALSRLHDDLLAGARVSNDAWVPNAGRLLVRRIFNALKRRHPFVELLKPETEVALPCLLALGGFGQLAATIRWNLRAQWLLKQGRARAQARFGEISTQVGDNFAAYSRAGSPALWALLWPGFTPAERLRRTLSTVVAHDTTFQLDVRDWQFEDVMRGIGPEVNFVVTGHTRLERAIPVVQGRQSYYNTGTWSRLMRLGSELVANPEAFSQTFEVLAAGRLDSLDAATTSLGDGSSIPLVLLRPTTLLLSSEADRTVGQLFHVFDEPSGQVRLEPLLGTRFECP